MSEPSTHRGLDPAAGGIHAYIEQLKATEELLTGLLPAGRTGAEAAVTTASAQDVEPAASARAGRRRWRRRTD